MAILYVDYVYAISLSLTAFIQEDALGDIAKKAGGFALGALIGKGGSKFGGLDIKRVYFGLVRAVPPLLCMGQDIDRMLETGYATTVRYGITTRPSDSEVVLT